MFGGGVEQVVLDLEQVCAVLDRPDARRVVAGRDAEPADLALLFQGIDRLRPVRRLQDVDAWTVQHVQVDGVSAEALELAVDIAQDRPGGVVTYRIALAELEIDI